ncbi:hypothetical protein LZC95_31465 [Pendulispora brunnea]|uniref:Uncharacterized protein n=1 Tax=Pendulispora brunnea TaxID=2905690 RepID=A0ABZ2JWV8_9BACT
MQHRLPFREPPRAIRLHRPAGATNATNATAAPPRVPFGLAAWSDDPGAPVLAIELGPLAGSAFLDLTSQIAATLPDPASMPAGTCVVILGEAPAPAGLVARLLQSLRRTESVPRTARASALLARGYTRIGAARDEASAHDLVWGFVTSAPSS